MPFFSLARCPLCAMRPPHRGRLCSPCVDSLSAPPEGAEGLAPFAFTGALARAVRRAKYGPDAALARGLGRVLADRAAPELRDRVDCVTFVPAHWRRRMARGLYLPEVLAHAVAKSLGRPCRALLGCSRHEPPLAGASATERASRVDGRYRARTRARGVQRALLVDDVVTTGSTLRSAGAALEDAGWGVVPFALAATPTHRFRP